MVLCELSTESYPNVVNRLKAEKGSRTVIWLGWPIYEYLLLEATTQCCDIRSQHMVLLRSKVAKRTDPNDRLSSKSQGMEARIGCIRSFDWLLNVTIPVYKSHFNCIVQRLIIPFRVVSNQEPPKSLMPIFMKKGKISSIGQSQLVSLDVSPTRISV